MQGTLDTNSAAYSWLSVLFSTPGIKKDRRHITWQQMVGNINFNRSVNKQQKRWIREVFRQAYTNSYARERRLPWVLYHQMYNYFWNIKSKVWPHSLLKYNPWCYLKVSRDWYQQEYYTSIVPYRLEMEHTGFAYHTPQCTSAGPFCISTLLPLR